MEIKKTNSFSVLSFKKQVKLSDLQEYVRIKARELYVDAIHNNLEVMGPVYWVYYGMNGDANTPFTLEIALPVHKLNGYKGDFDINSLGAFKYVSLTHNGEWQKLPSAYATLFGDLKSQGYAPSGESREVYIHIDFSHPENNITEVQVGIQ